MPTIRVEWLPVQLYGLGHLGFDHLQLVFEPGDGARQDDWFVMEGSRERDVHGTFLRIDGADGRTTLSTAKLAARDDLAAKIGLPAERGSRMLPYDGDEFRAWETMASYARGIDEEDYPYIALGLPASPSPTINSSSAVASLLHYSGLDPRAWLPFGLRLSPGVSTLLGTAADDRMRIENGFTTLLGGRGDDVFEGGGAPGRIDKFYGGEGDDLFRWSPGFNIVHGGQPLLDYRADGTDVMDYSGAGRVTITFDPQFVAHKTPNFVAVFKGGVDHLFSIERIQWNARTDEIVLGDGLDLVEDNRILHPASLGEDGGPSPDLRSAALVPAATAVAAASGTAVEGSAFGAGVPTEPDLGAPPPGVLDTAVPSLDWPQDYAMWGLF